MLACEARQLSPHTIADYRNTMRLFIEHAGDVAISGITSAQISAFLGCQGTVKAKTVLNYHVGLSSLWTWALKEGYVKNHVVRLVEPPRPDERAIEPFSELELRAMFSAIRQNPDRDRAMLLVLVDTGCRASEFCSLSQSNVDLSTRRIKLMGKGRKERIIPFSTRTAAALFKHMSTMDENAGAKIFPFNRDTLLKHIKRIGKRAGVSDCHPHRFRHTFATNFLRFGGSPLELQDILGHSSMEMVRRYVKIANTDLDAAHRRASPVENWKL